MSAHKFFVFNGHAAADSVNISYAKYVPQVKQSTDMALACLESLHTLWSLLKQGIAKALMPFKSGVVERLLTGVRLHELHMEHEAITAIRGD